MLITYHGHSEFLLEGRHGFSLLTDPFDAHVGYPMEEVQADIVTCSHGHGDHAFTEKVTGNPMIIREAGVWQAGPDAKITAIPSFHDDVQGAKRGHNLLMKIEAEGLSIVHLGDLGVSLSPEQIAALGQIDILLIPVGGFYTIDAKAAYETVQALKPRIVIPMHYKTEVNRDWPIAEAADFLRLMGCEKLAPLPLLRVTRGDLSQQPGIVMLAHP